MSARSWKDTTELQVLNINRNMPTAAIALALKRAGFDRTEAAIDTQLTRMGMRDGEGTVCIDNLPTHCDHLANHMVPSIPSSLQRQEWHSIEYPIAVVMTRPHESEPFEEIWTSTLRPGFRCTSYHMLRAALSP